MSLKEFQRGASEVYSLMKQRYPSVKWEAEHFMLDLVEEVGELSNALLVERGHKFISRQKSTLEDAFFDVLFDLFLLAESLKVDLDRAFQEGLEDLKRRIEEGEFD